MVVCLLVLGTLETIPSAVQFVKAITYEIRQDDGFLLLHALLALLSLATGTYLPHPRLLPLYFPFTSLISLINNSFRSGFPRL